MNNILSSLNPMKQDQLVRVRVFQEYLQLCRQLRLLERLLWNLQYHRELQQAWTQVRNTIQLYDSWKKHSDRDSAGTLLEIFVLRNLETQEIWSTNTLMNSGIFFSGLSATPTGRTEKEVKAEGDERSKAIQDVLDLGIEAVVPQNRQAAQKLLEKQIDTDWRRGRGRGGRGGFEERGRGGRRGGRRSDEDDSSVMTLDEWEARKSSVNTATKVANISSRAGGSILTDEQLALQLQHQMDLEASQGYLVCGQFSKYYSFMFNTFDLIFECLTHCLSCVPQLGMVQIFCRAKEVHQRKRMLQNN